MKKQVESVKYDCHRQLTETILKFVNIYCVNYILSHDTSRNRMLQYSRLLWIDSHHGDVLPSELRLMARCDIDSEYINRNEIDCESINHVSNIYSIFISATIVLYLCFPIIHTHVLFFLIMRTRVREVVTLTFNVNESFPKALLREAIVWRIRCATIIRDISQLIIQNAMRRTYRVSKSN